MWFSSGDRLLPVSGQGSCGQQPAAGPHRRSVASCCSGAVRRCQALRVKDASSFQCSASAVAQCIAWSPPARTRRFPSPCQ
eukprot:11097437-Alexandrium_andersonii.AAC.2